MKKRESVSAGEIHTGPSPAGRFPVCEGGSAYIVTLLVLAVLGILGLNVTMVTQTELLTGSDERRVTQVLYAADSGLSESIARTIVFYNFEPKTHVVEEQSSNPPIESQIEVSWVLPILDAPCNLCQINQNSSFSKINHAVTVTATRRGAEGGETIAEQKLAAMVELQPRVSDISAMNITPEELAKIDF